MLEPRFVSKPEIKLVGVTVQTSIRAGANRRAIPQFWDHCSRTGILAKLVRLRGPLGLIGVSHDFEVHSKYFEYSIMVEAGDSQRPNWDDVRTLTLPPANYAVFTAVGALPQAVQNLLDRIYQQWFDRSGYRHAASVDFESYPPFADERGDPMSSRCVSEVWVPILSSESSASDFVNSNSPH